MSSRSRGVPGSSMPSRTSSPKLPTSWTSRSTKPACLMWPRSPKNCRWVGFTPTAEGSCLTSGQSLYTKVVAALAFKPQTALSKNSDKNSLPAARGLPRSWDDIATGHLVIAQESLEYGWHEAIVLDRKGDTFILQYRDYPHLPKFARQRTGVALMCSADNEQSWNEIASGHLVLAPGPASDGWWEAIVTDRKADSLTLRFRDYQTLPKIVRHRSAIALMYRANEGHRPEADAQQG